MSLTNEDKAKIDRVLTNYSRWTWIRIIYILSMSMVCWYSKYTGRHEFWYNQILSFVLTANVIWLWYDVFNSPLSRMLKVIEEINASKNSRFS